MLIIRIIVFSVWINLKFELFLSPDFVSPGVNEGDEVLLVSHCYGAAIWSPADVDILTLQYTIMFLFKLYGLLDKFWPLYSLLPLTC